MKYLLLFDIDGTILKLRRGISRGLFVDLFKEFFDYDFPESSLPNFSGKTDLSILNQMCKYTNIPFHQVTTQIDKIWLFLENKFAEKINKSNIELITGIEEFIRLLIEDKRFELGLLTGNFKRNAFLKLSVFDLHGYFKDGAFGCDMADRNLLPEIAIRRYNKNYDSNVFNSSNSMIIGDTLHDVECAEVNGLACLTVGEELLELESNKSDYHILDFSNPQEIIDSILNIMENKNK